MSRTVVVTGGTRGIGRAIVTRFAALDDDVIVLGRNAGLLAEWDSVDAVRTVACDVTDEQQVEAALGAVAAVDVLVNNAGTSESAPLHRTTLDSWYRQLRVNATGAFLCTRAVIHGMRMRGHGAIVTVASTAGRMGASYTAGYSASKHAAVGLMRVAAAELAGTGATANAVCPTFVDTEMTRRSAARIAEKTGRSERESSAALAASSPLGRLLAPDEVAAAVVWLASPEAVAINGQALIVDGGGVQA
jgi:NAD(P)-dependent dehydrogenase (short-subunit alcohol dehydrogenase family)